MSLICPRGRLRTAVGSIPGCLPPASFCQAYVRQHRVLNHGSGPDFTLGVIAVLEALVVGPARRQMRYNLLKVSRNPRSLGSTGAWGPSAWTSVPNESPAALLAPPSDAPVPCFGIDIFGSCHSYQVCPFAGLLALLRAASALGLAQGRIQAWQMPSHVGRRGRLWSKGRNYDYWLARSRQPHMVAASAGRWRVSIWARCRSPIVVPMCH